MPGRPSGFVTPRENREVFVGLRESESLFSSPYFWVRPTFTPWLKPVKCCGMESRGMGESARLALPTSEQPDFALIYAFLGSLFDPSCASLDHMDVLDQMKDIDRQTATLLMRNVISNLQNPEAWQEHVRMLQKTALRDGGEREPVSAGTPSQSERHPASGQRHAQPGRPNSKSSLAAHRG
ncbi:hypothetical protein WJX84_009467 [Apatococcus fuscideae]|uniref:Uncharacterized protein n=1 Tax=Apatococcus fuscideae TaxID=2026836 RepID=A0AAW1T7Q0_9CHLO